jgi:5,10-methylenetetrahydrofolate reductase
VIIALAMALAQLKTYRKMLRLCGTSILSSVPLIYAVQSDQEKKKAISIRNSLSIYTDWDFNVYLPTMPTI